MLYLGLDAHPAYATNEVASFGQHTLFTARLSQLDLPSHQSNFGLITTLYGVMDVKINGISKLIDNSSFLIVNRGSSIQVTIDHEQCQPVLLYFKNTPDDWNITERVYQATPSLKERIKNLSSLTESCSSFISMQSDAIVRSTLAEIVSLTQYSTEQSKQLAVKKKGTREDNFKKLATARDWIENNFAQSLSLHQLAQMASMNDEHFLRQFKKLYNKTPHQYLIDRRIQAARELLNTKEMSVQEICSAVGWESLATFSHLFKQRTGVTPGEYRNAEDTR
ncbi:MAG: AraC family transcriptional regulator [Bacteroidota bacterium]